MATAASSMEVLRRLELRATEAEEMIHILKEQISEIKAVQFCEQGTLETLSLKEENEQLKQEIEIWRKKLIDAESRNGVLQVPLPEETTKNLPNGIHVEKELPSDVKEKSPSQPEVKETSPDPQKPVEKKGKTKKKQTTSTAAGNKPEVATDHPVDVSCLDFRIGRIVTAKKHPDADSLYVEEVDVGEEKLRTVVSGLVKFVPIEEMQNRMAVLLCNLKPAKMRGVLSEAMVMCASTPEKVEILIPPPGTVPGERVICEAFPGQPLKELSAKKKIFEQVAPDLKTDGHLVATFKGKELIVPGKGSIKAPSLANVQIK